MDRSFGGLSEFVAFLENLGEVRRISTPCDARHETAMILSRFSGEDIPALFFEKIRDRAMPLVGNLLGTRRRLALALGVTEADLNAGRIPNQECRILPVRIPHPEPRERVQVQKNFDIGTLLPVLTHYVKDTGPFITCGVTSAKDPRNGGTGRGLHRIEVRGKDTLGISLVNPPLSDIFAYHRQQGTRMELATAIGVDPVVLMATVFKAPGETDKLAVAGGLMGKPVALEPANTVDVEVPAFSEILIEGYIDPQEAQMDGILGEVSGYYISFSSPMFHVTEVSFRKSPLFHAIVPQSLEVDHLLALIHGMNFIPKMKREFAAIRHIHFTPGTFGSHVAISMAGDHPGDARRALTMALSFQNVKKATLVSDDVDPSDPLAVEWAVATRFQADRDLVVIPDLTGQPIDPSSKEGFLTAKIGLDATRPRKTGFEKITFPENVLDRWPSLIELLEQERRI